MPAQDNKNVLNIANISISSKTLFALSICILLSVIMLYLCHTAEIQFADYRLRFLCHLFLLIMPLIPICIFVFYGPTWLKMMGILLAIPQFIVVLVLLLAFPSELVGFIKGEDPNMLLVSRKWLGSKYLCRYYVEGTAANSMREVFRYEDPIFPSIVKITKIISVHPDYDEYRNIKEQLEQRGTISSFKRESQKPELLLMETLRSYFGLPTTGGRIEYELLSPLPPRNTSFQKFYVWVKTYEKGHLAKEGAIQLVCLDEKRYGVVEFTDIEFIKMCPDVIKRIYPNKLCATIFEKAFK